MTLAKALTLLSDAYSPMSKPHGLPALHWHSLVQGWLSEDGGVEMLEDKLRRSGWDPQWRFGMYSQAHYHSTTHELLVVIEGEATIQLGGTDDRARPRNSNSDSSCSTFIELNRGDVLLLPAGYSHRSRESRRGFTMIGSYPRGAEHWDMRFPNVMGCPHDCKKIESLTTTAKRKGLFEALSPEVIFNSDLKQAEGEVEQHWQL